MLKNYAMLGVGRKPNGLVRIIDNPIVLVIVVVCVCVCVCVCVSD